MQTEKFKVLLYLKKSGLDKSGQAPIMGRITYERTMAQFSCKLSRDPDLWNARESRLNGKSREAVVTNVLERYDRMVEEMKQKLGIEIKATTLNSYYTIRKHLQVFIRKKYHTTDIPFGQVEEDFLECLQHNSVRKLGHSQGYYRKMDLAVKKVCRFAYREGLTERQLFAHMEIERGEHKQPRALNRASLDKLEGLTFEAYEVELETARNLFLFSYYTAVAYYDMVALGREHLFRIPFAV
ncbi:hypothetical protein HMPREF1981_02358 [Bacteroides pyogenes F0041]|uniref:Arm DNA-binding domain-containing protein n=1 Tax=Bacteroides pyogenes F0041 TaxID=1321819 RepID=U2DXE2_9BACE|nr:hypothetical protein HMPREF1981_02358 [Bacteroides pyogenes F0041]MBB3895755.1 hypothetical protein [Bacteroides pyogenes]GAE22256.1 integrase [Bacteroides pyogenes JCM 10003]SUV31420.1 integrase [Bacteroides pyogenes]